MSERPLTYRTIDPRRDARLAVRHQREACIASFGTSEPMGSPDHYLKALTAKVEEFPDGFVLAYEDGTCVGQLGLEVPYGLTTGYVELFYVRESFRRQGYGRRMHEYAVQYFRSWEADVIDLHVSPRNRGAIRFYKALGYGLAGVDGRMWRMRKQLQSADPPWTLPSNS